MLRPANITDRERNPNPDLQPTEQALTLLPEIYWLFSGGVVGRFIHSNPTGGTVVQGGVNSGISSRRYQPFLHEQEELG